MFNKSTSIHAKSRKVLKEWLIDHISIEKFKEINSNETSVLLQIKCSCDREYNYNQWKNVPRVSKKCKCGNMIIQYGK